MIVDLLRNDISRISKPGTIHVNKPFFIESYKTVYQMTSMVSGRLEAETSLTDILKASSFHVVLLRAHRNLIRCHTLKRLRLILDIFIVAQLDYYARMIK